MKLLATAIGGACLALAGHAAAIDFATGDSRPLSEPVVPATCKLLRAGRTASDRQFDPALESAPPDTQAIQTALTDCASKHG
ncbi:endopolygalacturonase, partial [Xanthomonas perforans]